MFYEDEYQCPLCGRPNETCRCDDEPDYADDIYDEYFEEEDDEEPICFINGYPLYRSLLK